MTKLAYIEINPVETADATVIWCHGLGADGHDFEPIVPELHLPAHHRIRFIFPHAPMRAVTVNNGMRMRAWYDIYSFDFARGEDESGVCDSQALINELIIHETERGIASSRIVLAGFSQGGAMALFSGLCYPQPLGGILALSCYLPLHRVFTARATATNKTTPIFMAHGTHDNLVPLLLGQTTCQFLQAQGYQIDWKTYPIEHALCGQEINDISRWFSHLLAETVK